MRQPRPLVAYEIETGNATRHASVRDAEKASGVSQVYLTKRINSNKPAKGFLFYDAAKAYTTETIAKVRKLSPAFNAAFKARKGQPDHEISVRIDPRTVIMVKASKWTPDYADRYRERMAASLPSQRWSGDQCMRLYNDTLKPKRPKRGPGRPRKEAR